MPIAGILFWIAALVASRLLTPQQLALFVGFGSGTIFPLGLAIDRLRGRKEMADPNSPISIMFFHSLCAILLMWPLIIFSGSVAPSLVVLGGAVLMGLLWILVPIYEASGLGKPHSASLNSIDRIRRDASPKGRNASPRAGGIGPAILKPLAVSRAEVGKAAIGLAFPFESALPALGFGCVS